MQTDAGVDHLYFKTPYIVSFRLYSLGGLQYYYSEEEYICEMVTFSFLEKMPIRVKNQICVLCSVDFLLLSAFLHRRGSVCDRF